MRSPLASPAATPACCASRGVGYFDPDIVTFYGTDPDGTRVQLVQHVTQLNVMLRAMPKDAGPEPAKRIGFRLAADLEQEK